MYTINGNAQYEVCEPHHGHLRLFETPGYQRSILLHHQLQYSHISHPLSAVGHDLQDNQGLSRVDQGPLRATWNADLRLLSRRSVSL